MYTTRQRIAVVSAGLSNPSSTRLLADRLAAASVRHLSDHSVETDLDMIALRDHAHDIADTLLTGVAPPALARTLDAVASADALIAVTPIFNASFSGLFKSFFDVLDRDALGGIPVLLGATAGSARHSLALEYTIRPLFAALRAEPVVTAVFAAPEDWQSGGRRSRR